MWNNRYLAAARDVFTGTDHPVACQKPVETHVPEESCALCDRGRSDDGFGRIDRSRE